ncbi:hypothetical protein AnigIFM59636_003537 [Aspergillus niger]|nr:hypothetical protein AnigIFM59636_003537 [Aspergillus niger]
MSDVIVGFQLAGSLIEILTKARMLSPAQLADVLQRARRVNAIQSWAESITITGDQLTSHGDALPRNRAHPDRIEPRIDNAEGPGDSTRQKKKRRRRRRRREKNKDIQVASHPFDSPNARAPEDGQWLRTANFEQVLRLSARLIDPAPRTVLEPLLVSWNSNVSQGLHALGLPLEWMGVEAAAAYAVMLKDNMIPDAVGRRAARMLLVLNYEEMCQFPECYCPRPRRAAEQKKAYVMNCILHACVLEDPSKSDRDLIHNYLRQGRWLWVIASIVGLGFALICSEELMSTIRNVSITNNGVNALATHAFYARPGMVALLHSLETAVADLMSGKIPRSLCENITNEPGILGQFNLSRMNEIDRVHLALQHDTGNWEPIDLEAAIHDVKKRLLPNILGTHLAVKHDPPSDDPSSLKQTTSRGEAANVQWLSALGDRTILDPGIDDNLNYTTMPVNHFQNDDIAPFTGP